MTESLTAPLTIAGFIKELEKEMAKATKDSYTAEQLERLQSLARDYEGDDKVISSFDILERMKNKPPEKKIMSGYRGLDAILDGFREKQLVVISAATKSGKTSFCIDITVRIKDENPLWLPFEEPAEELIQKFLDRGDQPPLFYTPERMTGNTLVWVEKKIIEAKAKYNSRVVFIDHLHFIVPITADRQDLAIGYAMRELKRMAKQWGVVVVLIAHLKKTKVETQPDIEDLRDSSFIAQEADTVIMLWRETMRENGKVIITNNINVSVQANRRTGKTGNFQMVYDKGVFREIDWEHSAEPTDKEWEASDEF